MSTYANPLTDYSPQMEFFDGSTRRHFRTVPDSGVSMRPMKWNGPLNS
jgi:hypothetical protein